MHFYKLINKNKIRECVCLFEKILYSTKIWIDWYDIYFQQGPYVYELFSIMVHSGSANGGHYYAYIK